MTNLLKKIPPLDRAILLANTVVLGLVTTWRFALLLQALIAIHETGHVLAVRRFGIGLKEIKGLPLAGAAVVPEKAYPDRAAEAWTFLAGPLFGGGLGFVLFLAYLWTNWAPLGMVALLSVSINGLNLVPFVPLDGGHIVRTFSAGLKRPARALIFGLTSAVAGMYLFKTAPGLVWYCLPFFAFSAFISLRPQPEAKPFRRKSAQVILATYLAAGTLFIATAAFLSRVPSVISYQKTFMGRSR